MASSHQQPCSRINTGFLGPIREPCEVASPGPLAGRGEERTCLGQRCLLLCWITIQLGMRSPSWCSSQPLLGWERACVLLPLPLLVRASPGFFGASSWSPGLNLNAPDPCSHEHQGELPKVHTCPDPPVLPPKGMLFVAPLQAQTSHLRASAVPPAASPGFIPLLLRQPSPRSGFRPCQCFVPSYPKRLLGRPD